jgi:mannitol/fructose-specific phosphotransferase system IIA component (Ntr-type)
MNLSSFLTRNMVAAKLSSVSPREAIEQIVGSICSRKGLRNKKEILSSILSREEQLGTVIGEWVAAPHARIENLLEPILFVATLKPSIGF